jgi:hypothetical protein
MLESLRFAFCVPSLRALALCAPLLATQALGCAAEPASYETFEEACAAVPGCGESRYPIEGNLEPIYRVLVVRSAEGTFSIAQSERIELVEGDGIPLGPSGGDVLLAGRNASGEPVDGQLIRLPTTRLLEDLSANFPSEEQSLEGEATSAIGYVRALPDVTELVLLDLEGNAIVQAPLPVAPPEEEGVSREALIATSSSACAHVRVLDGEADREWLNKPYPILRPSPLQLALIDAALGRVSPLLCSGLSRIVLIDGASIPEAGQFRGVVYPTVEGDVLYVNVTSVNDGVRRYTDIGLQSLENQAVFQHVVTHETAHTFEALLNAERGGGQVGGWSPGARSIAQQTIEHVRLRGTLRSAWVELHAQFVSFGLAEAFTRTRMVASPLTIAEAGSMSLYGSTNAADDIAEMIARPITGPEFERLGVSSVRDADVSGCVQMRTYTDESVPARYAALFTKLRFLQDLGVISEADVRWCTGPSLGLRDAGDEGFEFSQDGVPGRSFIADTDSRIENSVYEFGATGGVAFGEENFRARARLRLNMPEGEEQAGLPRGIYQLSLATSDDFRVVVADQPAASFVVSDGFVLIASATNDRIVGSIFITEGFRYDAPFPVPQVFDPPLNISFVDNMPPP